MRTVKRDLSIDWTMILKIILAKQNLKMLTRGSGSCPMGGRTGPMRLIVLLTQS